MKTFQSLAVVETSPLPHFIESPGLSGPSFFTMLHSIFMKLAPFLVGLLVVIFFYGLITFFWKRKEEGEVLEKSKKLMIYSGISLLLVVFVLGIVIINEQTASKLVGGCFETDCSIA